IWSAETGQCAAHLKNEIRNGLFFTPHSLVRMNASGSTFTLRGPSNRVQVTRMIWSPDGKRILAHFGEHYARVWEAGTGREILTHTKHQAHVRATLSCSPETKYPPPTPSAGPPGAARGQRGRYLRLWAADTGTEARRWLATEDNDDNHRFGVAPMLLAWSVQQNQLVTVGQRNGGAEVKLWTGSGEKTVASLTLPGFTVESLSFSPDGKRLA